MIAPQALRPAEEPSSSLDVVSDLLDAQIRVTSQRIAILEAMGELPMALTAAQIHDRLKHSGTIVGLATVYRNLGILEHAGLIHSMKVGEEQAYSRCPGEHEHARCQVCRRVIRLAGLSLSARARVMLLEEGMDLLESRLELVGICHTCKTAEPAAPERH